MPGALRIHRRPGGSVAAGHEPAAQSRADGGILGGVQARRRGARGPRSNRPARVHPGDRVLRVRLSQVARRRVRLARLPVGVAAALSPGGVLLRPLQQPADGVLLTRRAGTRRPTKWRRDPTARCERERRGPYVSVGDFARRAPPKLKRTAIEHLVWVGGCDGFGLTRRELLWQVGLWLPPEAVQGVDARGRRQLELALNHPHEGLRFGGLAAAERLLAEYAVLGFAASGHPLSLLRGSLPPGVVQSDALPRLEHGSWVEVAGLVVARQRPETAKGFIFVLLEDEAGMV